MRRRPEAGSVAVELAIITPVLIISLLFVAGLGRMAAARHLVEAAAAESARAASLERNTALSTARARDMAEQALDSAGLACSQLDVDVDVSSYRPGGHVRVRVECTAALSDVIMAGFPRNHRFVATSTVPIEHLRAP